MSEFRLHIGLGNKWMLLKCLAQDLLFKQYSGRNISITPWSCIAQKNQSHQSWGGGV
jgi:hypothetical protein